MADDRTQAQRVFDRFGGVPALVEALRRLGAPLNRAVVYKWNMPESRGGTGGLIPTRRWKDIFRAASQEGIALGPEDTFPGRVL